MCCDYRADLDQGRENKGLLQFPESDLRERLIGAHLAGWQLAIHAIGDAALDVVMDIIEEAQQIRPRPDARHCLEHVSVVSADPILNIAALVNRQTSSGADFVPAERITVEQAVRAYTVGSARAVHREADLGTLSPGKLADFVVLSEDLYTVPAEQIESVRVTATVVGGRLVAGSL